MRLAAILMLGALSACGGGQTADNVTILSFDQVEMIDGGVRYTVERDGKRTHIDFPVSLDRVAPERVHIGVPIHTTDDGIVVMRNDFASRPIDGRCEDGVESFVRVFSLPERRQLAAIPAVSCHENIGADVTRVPTVTWVGDGHFRIEGDPARNFAIEDGRVTELKGA